MCCKIGETVVRSPYDFFKASDSRESQKMQGGIMLYLPHMTTVAAVQQKLHSLTLTLLLQLLMTALISGDQQSNTLTVARLVSESYRPGCARPAPISPFTPSLVPQKHTPLTQQVLHKLLLPSSPHERTQAHTCTHKLRPGRSSRG